MMTCTTMSCIIYSSHRGGYEKAARSFSPSDLEVDISG